MTAFSYHHNHHHPFPLGPAQGMTTESSSFLYHHGQTEASSTELRSRSSSISNVNGDHHNRIVSGSLERKRSRHDSLLSPVMSKETKEGRSRKQKKPIEETKKKAGEEPPAGYIHVRARRGQATDSHSLAERVRREKISERMKVLQGLVPGCDKVVGKALMLDEIINYVQSLQNQIEFLSMKLACVNPLLFDFSVDYECCPINEEKVRVQFEEVGSMTESQPMPSSLLEATLIQPTTIDRGTIKEYEAMIMNPPPLLLQDQGSIPLSQENGSFFMQAGDQRQELFNHIMLNNMRSFE